MKSCTIKIVDNNQNARLLKNGNIKVTSKYGRKTVFSYIVNPDSFLIYNQSYNERYNHIKFVEEQVKLLDLSWLDIHDPFYGRIIEAQVIAIEKLIDANEQIRRTK